MSIDEEVHNAQIASTTPQPIVARKKASFTADARKKAGDNPGARLTLLRIRAGYVSTAHAARAFGINAVTLGHHESGHRGITPHAAQIYGRLLNVPPSVILFGDEPHRLQSVMVTAQVGPEGVVSALLERQAPLAAPPTAFKKLEALLVATEALYPQHRQGDLLIFAPRFAGDNSDPHGRECVVETMLRERFLCRPHREGNQRWTLISPNRAPRQSVVLTAASPILWVRPAAPG